MDDNIGTHRKTLKAGAEASWLWVSAIGYCRRHLTDGFVPTEALRLLGRFSTRPSKLADRLVHAKLFERTAGGYKVHDYLGHNDSRATVEGLRAKEKARKAAYRAQVSQRDIGTVPAGHPRDGESVPVSSRARVSTTPPNPQRTYEPDRREGALQEGGTGETNSGPSARRAPALTGRNTYTPIKDRPGFAQICALVTAERAQYPDEDPVSFLEHCKVVCARAGLVYDGAHLAAALDAVDHARSSRRS